LMSSLHLHEVPVKALMTPRKSMEVLNASSSVKECLAEVARRQHSRYPVYYGHTDNIIGIVHIRDLIRLREQDIQLRHALAWHSPPFVPANKNALQQLFDFQSRHEHMAIVVDEYGDIDGLITMEDILEEIVGEIEDESDRPVQPRMWPQADGSLIVAGTVSIHDINQELDTSLPEEGATTIGGLIVEKLGAQPEAKMCLDIKDAHLEVLNLEGRWISRVRIRKKRSRDG
jgi:Putative Mg2+ and Co2+ transporter CorB